jgi:hypothetical protein
MRSPSSGPNEELASLFQFYGDYVKVLYTDASTNASLPVEVLFEIHAAFDHLSRIWRYGDPENLGDFERAALEKAHSHLKRSCLDIFKIKAREANRQFRELCSVDIGVIEGSFKTELIDLFGRIKDGVNRARLQEGDTRDDRQAVKAFDLWAPVYELCWEFERDYFQSRKVDWAKTISRARTWRDYKVQFLISFLAGIAVGAFATLSSWIRGLLAIWFSHSSS